MPQFEFANNKITKAIVQLLAWKSNGTSHKNNPNQPPFQIDVLTIIKEKEA